MIIRFTDAMRLIQLDINLRVMEKIVSLPTEVGLLEVNDTLILSLYIFPFPFSIPIFTRYRNCFR